MECNAALVAENFTEGQEYESANIYVRKVTEKAITDNSQAMIEVPYITALFHKNISALMF